MRFWDSEQDCRLCRINWYNRLPAMMKLTCRCWEGKNVHIFCITSDQDSTFDMPATLFTSFLSIIMRYADRTKERRY